MDQNYSYFLKANVGRYLDNWIAIVDKKIVSHGKSAKKTYQEAKKKFPDKSPLMAKIPSKQTMIL